METPGKYIDIRTYVAHNTVTISELFMKEIQIIHDIIKSNDDEIVQMIWSHDSIGSNLKIEKNIIVGITNLRIFKLEKGNVFTTEFKNIKSVHVEKNGIFRWDKIVCKLVDGKCETYGIYNGDACEHICYNMKKYLG